MYAGVSCTSVYECLKFNAFCVSFNIFMVLEQCLETAGYRYPPKKVRVLEPSCSNIQTFTFGYNNFWIIRAKRGEELMLSELLINRAS